MRVSSVLCWFGWHDEACTWGEPYTWLRVNLVRDYFYTCKRCGRERVEKAGTLVELI